MVMLQAKNKVQQQYAYTSTGALIILCGFCRETKTWPVYDYHGVIICEVCGKLNQKDW